MTRKLLLALAVLSVLTAACGGGGDTEADGSPEPTAVETTTPVETTPPETESPECSPDGTELQVVAEDLSFDTDCLAAPADTAFTIEFDNRDEGVPHNIDIEAEDGAAAFGGAIITGPTTTTYDVDALAAGTYSFFCRVHPGPMQGTFVVA